MPSSVVDWCCSEGVSLSDLLLIVGDQNKEVFEGSEEMARVERIITHEDYGHSEAGGMANDLALLKLETPLNFNERVRPVCLSRDHPGLNSTCYAIGWGITEGGG